MIPEIGKRKRSSLLISNKYQYKWPDQIKEEMYLAGK